MGAAKRYFAFSLLILGMAGGTRAEDQSFEDVQMTDVRVVMTSGTAVLQDLEASEAQLHGNGKSVSVKDLMFRAPGAGKNPLRARSPSGEIMLGGDLPPREPPPPPSFPVIRDYARNFTERGAKGDVMLYGKEEKAVASVEDVGEVRSDIIIWSKKYSRVLMPRKFEQRLTGERGQPVDIHGGGLSASNSFQEWIYFAGEERPGRLEYDAAADVPASNTKEDK